MPVPKGTIVEVFSGEDPKTARGGVVQRIGVAGIDLIQSWYWTAETRDTQRALPIDRYRSWKWETVCTGGSSIAAKCARRRLSVDLPEASKLQME
jgi:hypothetical protein